MWPETAAAALDAAEWVVEVLDAGALELAALLVVLLLLLLLEPPHAARASAATEAIKAAEILCM